MTAIEGLLNGLLFLEREEAKGLLWPDERELGEKSMGAEAEEGGARVRCRERI